MIIYEFSTWWTKHGELFSVKEIEVEEKTKTYIGKGCRINKGEIGLLQNSWGNRMYLLENKPEIYINAMIERCKKHVETAEIRLKQERESLSKWNALAEQKGKNDVQED